MNPKRTLIVIHADNVTDFRAQLNAAIEQALWLDDVPVLPEEGVVSEAALVSALADVVERARVMPAVVQSAKAA
jgi:hypothetical protein